MAAGRQILADRQHLDVVRSHVAHDLKDLLVGLSQAQHQAALGRHIGRKCLELLEQVQAERVVGSGTRFLVQAWHGLEVVVHHIRRRSLQDVERSIEAASEIRREDLDAGSRAQRAHFADALDEVPCAAVAQVVAVHAGDHHIPQLERSNRLGQIERLVGIERIWTAMAHVAKRATPGALVAHDHESRGALAKALADVGAGCFLAHRMELVLAQDLLDFVKACAGRAGLDANPVWLFQRLGRNDLDRDARGLGLRLLLGAGVVGRRLLLDGGHGVRRHRRLSRQGAGVRASGVPQGDDRDATQRRKRPRSRRV